jgi:hypothetical protein
MSECHKITVLRGLTMLADTVLENAQELDECQGFLKGIARQILQKVVDDLLCSPRPLDVGRLDEVRVSGSSTPSGINLPPPEGATPTATSADGTSESDLSAESFPIVPAPSGDYTIRLEQLPNEQLPGDLQSDTITASNGTKRDFSKWCATRRLPQGHTFYLTGGGQQKQAFRLCWTGAPSAGTFGRRALLETTCPDGKILRSPSPSGILKAYFKNTTNREWKGDAWSRLSMRSNLGTLWNIKDAQWEKFEWQGGRWVNVLEELEGTAEGR